MWILYPLDYARNRLAADIGLDNGIREFRTTMDCWRLTFVNDGPTGLYRGFGVTCLGIIVYRALYFGLYDNLFLSYPTL